LSGISNKLKESQDGNARESFDRRPTLSVCRSRPIQQITILHPGSLVLGRFHRERWKSCWEELFRTHELVHNRRGILKIEVSKENDAALAVVDFDTLWCDEEGRDNHWKGRVNKGYTKMVNGEWKLVFHAGVLHY
jgi:hypothetical protein